MRATIKLFLWFAVMWIVAAEWTAAQSSLLNAVAWLDGFVEETTPNTLFGALVTVFGGVGLLVAVLQIRPVGGYLHTGELAHPVPRKPLRIRLRISRWRLLATVLAVALVYLLAVRALPVLIDPFDAVGGQAQPEGWEAAWLWSALWHLGVAALGWVILAVLGYGFARRSPEPYGFVRYHGHARPVFRMFWPLLVLVQLPLVAFSSINLAHPWHAGLSAASAGILLAAAVIAQWVTLTIELRRDRAMRRQAADAGGSISVQALRARTIEFLNPGRSGVLPAPLAQSPRERAAAREENAAEEARATAPIGEAPFADPDDRDAAMTNELGELDEVSRHDLAEGDDVAVHDLADEPAQPPPAVKPFASRYAPLDDAQEPAERWRAIKLAVAASLVLAGGMSIAAAWQLFLLPSGEETVALARAAHIHVRKSASGEQPVKLLGTRYDYSLNTGLENISEHFINAVVASEDHRFFNHGAAYKLAKFAEAGILCAARKLNIFSSARACAGNSTIGQQLARNLFLSEKRSVTRKVKELLWAIKMEWSLGKETILELYLNRIYLGRGNFGVELASRSYFRKSAAQLSLYEGALLAAAVKRPGWNWVDDRAGALERARLILALMRRHGHAPEGARFTARFRPGFGSRPPRKPYLGHLWQWIRADVNSVLANLPPGDYKLMTSLNAEVEIYAERHLSAETARLRRSGVPVTQGAVVVMRPDGRVLAMVGGVGNDVRARGLNRVQRPRGLHARPPASAFKPFVYLAALETGLAADSAIDASPVYIDMPAPQRPYEPRNHDGAVYGQVTMRDGLVKSINTAAVHLLHETVGFDRLFDVLNRLGIDSSRFPRQWGVALGAASVPLIELAGAYATFANGGVAATPHALLAVTTAEGKIVWRRPRASGERRFARQDIHEMNAMLRAVVREGTGAQAREKLPRTLQVAGKTGTGDGFVDAWFIGYTADLVVGVWLGNDTPRAMRNLYGGTGPARVFNRIMRDLVEYTAIVDREKGLP